MEPGEYLEAPPGEEPTPGESGGELPEALPEFLPVHITAERYVLSLLPEDFPDRYLWQVAVEYRGLDRWAVLWNPYCLGAGGTWDAEPVPSSRDEEWLVAHRFTFGDAMRLAEGCARAVRVSTRYGSLSARDALLLEGKRAREGAPREEEGVIP